MTHLPQTVCFLYVYLSVLHKEKVGEMGWRNRRFRECQSQNLNSSAHLKSEGPSHLAMLILFQLHRG